MRARHMFALCGSMMLPATGAQGAINISTQATQNMSCSGGVCTATAQKAYLNVNDVTNMLAAGDLKIVSGAGAEDIHLQAPFSWTSTSRLTLDAQRSIEFEKAVSVAGTGALTLITNDGDTGGDYWFDEGASVSFWDTSSSLIINSQSYVLVKDIKTLASDIAANPSGNFALANSYDASVDGTYAHSPVATQFTGRFDGLGSSLSNLWIKDTTAGENVGLFAALGTDGIIRDTRLAHVHIHGDASNSIGSLLGLNDGGTVLRDEVRGGRVLATGETSGVGGLVGQSGVYLKQMATLDHASASIRVTQHANSDNYTGSAVGGLVGFVPYPSIINASSAHGSVVGDGAGDIGGLAGGAWRISASYADNEVQNLTPWGALTGGLAGGAGAIQSSRATGNVISSSKQGMAGGLVGLTGSPILTSSASGDVTVGNQEMAGGLVGGLFQGATLSQSFATGTVSGGNGAQIGGLVGWFTRGARVYDSYSWGAVSGGGETGGLIGYGAKADELQRTYSAGLVSGGVKEGAFIGVDKFSRPQKIKSNYFDGDKSGLSNACGDGPCGGIAEVTDAQLKSALPDGFDPQVWGQSPNINNGYPYLLANPPPKDNKAIKHRPSGANHAR